MVYDQYRGGSGQPWYVVFDRDMYIVYKGRGSPGGAEAEAVILGLLESR